MRNPSAETEPEEIDFSHAACQHEHLVAGGG
jgi:hypothetical protein